MKDVLSYQVQQLLRLNRISIDVNELTFQIKSHPTFPSLHAVTGVLDHFNIENLVLDIPSTPETLEQLPGTFLGQVEIGKEKQLAVVTKTKYGYQLLLSVKQKENYSESEFLERFTGVILVVDRNDSNALPNNSNLSSISKGLMFIAFAFFIAILFTSDTAITNYLFLSLSAIGIYLSITIFKQELGESTILGNAFCSKTTEKKSCDAVLTSKAATIYKNLKLNDISLMYFTSTSLTVFLLTLSNNSIFIVQLVSLLAIPAIIYSIYYQAVVIKKWCFLCLSIVVVLCCNACIAILFFQTTYNLESMLIAILSFSFVITIYLRLSKVLKNNDSLKRIKIEYYKLKRNSDLFNAQLDKSKTINTQIENNEEIIFGNKTSNLNITIITNPLCGHCKPVHKLIERILNDYSEHVKLTIRFNINPNNVKSPAIQISSRLLEIFHVDGYKSCLKAMHEIYGEMSIENWLKKYQHCTESEKYLQILESEYSWCTNNAINFTPEILINGKSYPKMFDRNDLIHFIESIEEHSLIIASNPEPTEASEA